MPLYHRRSIRLEGFDYRQCCGYFITLATSQHQNLFGRRQGEMIELNSFGILIAQHWEMLPAHFPVLLDEWIVMPDHLHAIILIDHPENSDQADIKAGANGVTPGSLGALLNFFKSTTARKINNLRHTPGQPVWQRNYYEHIIRDTEDMEPLRRYIAENPIHHMIKDGEDYPSLHKLV